MRKPGGNAQGGRVMKALPAPALVMRKAELLLEFLVVPLDAPAHFGDEDQLFKCGLGWGGREEYLVGRAHRPATRSEAIPRGASRCRWCPDERDERAGRRTVRCSSLPTMGQRHRLPVARPSPSRPTGCGRAPGAAGSLQRSLMPTQANEWGLPRSAASGKPLTIMSLV